jgi:HTH-type transcriptional regulator/antitoxin HigA
VERWESEHVVVPLVHGVELVKALLGERQLRRKDLVAVFGTESIVSEVLSGKRELQAKHIEGLAEFLHVSPAAFFAPPMPMLA